MGFTKYFQGWCLILEKAIEEVIEKYSNFTAIADAVHKFILEKEEAKRTFCQKGGTKKGKLEKKIDCSGQERENITLEKKGLKLKEAAKRKTKLKKDKEDDGEDEKEESSKNFTVIDYSLQEEQFLAENFYASNVDYNNLFSYSFTVPGTELGELYEQEESSSSSDTASETMSTEEAEEMLIDIQYAAVLGTLNDLNHDARRRFANWVIFNPALWRLFHANYAVTGDVDYSKMF